MIKLRSVAVAGLVCALALGGCAYNDKPSDNSKPSAGQSASKEASANSSTGSSAAAPGSEGGQPPPPHAEVPTASVPAGPFKKTDGFKLPASFGDWKAESPVDGDDSKQSVIYAKGETKMPVAYSKSDKDRASLVQTMDKPVYSEHGACGMTAGDTLTCFFFLDGGNLMMGFGDDKITADDATKIGEQLYGALAG